MAMLPHQYLASHCHHGADLISRSVGQPFVPVLCQRGWHPGWNVGVDLSQRLGKNHASDGTLWHLMAPYGIFSKKHYRASCTAEIRRTDNVCGWCGIAWSCSKCSKVSAITAPGFVWCHLTGFDVRLCFCFWCTPLLMISRCVTPSQVSESQKCWAVSSTHPIINCTQASLGRNTKWNCTVVITPTN